MTSAQRVPGSAGRADSRKSGLPGYEATLWTAVVMPANVPAPIVNKLHKVIEGALKEPEIVEALQAKGFIVGSSTPEQLRTQIEQDIKKWRDLAVKAKISIQ